MFIAMCNHNNISHSTSSDWESVCADCGEVVSTACKRWSRVSWADRYKLVRGDVEIVAIASGHDERRSWYAVKHRGVTVDECDTLREAKIVANDLF